MKHRIWNLTYRKTANYQPNSQIPDGVLAAEFINFGGGPVLPLEDATPDGGANLNNVTMFAGRRIRPEAVPPNLTWFSKRTPTDFQWTTLYSVSDRLRDLIEEIEPGIHQFEPLSLITKRGVLIDQRWFWQVCRRLDTVDSDKTTWRYRTFWSPTENSSRLVLDPVRAAGVHFWRDKHLIDPILLCSDLAKSRIEAAGMTGIVYREMETRR